MIDLLRSRVRQARSDRGAILLIAIIIVTVVSVVTGLVLTRGDGSLRATVALRDAARTSYAADAGAKVAINALRTGANAGTGTSPSYFTNVDGTGCFGFNGTVANPTNPRSTLVLNNLMPKAAGETQQAMSARVECAPDDDTGAQGSAVPINNSNKPGYAIVTLGGPLRTADTLKVHGGVYSNSTINGAVALDAGDVRAVGACAQTTVTAPGTKQCNTGSPIADPNYGDELGGSVPPLRRPPTSCSGNVATFEPGYYDNAAALSTASNLCALAWFKPGTYYFDFHNDSCANVCPTSIFGSAGNTWRLNGRKLIGGTWRGAGGNTNTPPPSNIDMNLEQDGVRVPTCVSPITDVNAQGVQFVFGGTSRLYIDQNTEMELCGSYHADRPPIVIHGLKNGGTPSAANINDLSASANPTAAGDGTWTGLTAPNVTSVANGNASWAPGSASARSTTVTANGFVPSTAIPAGAVVTSATLRVRHQNADATTNSAASATLRVGTTTSASLSLADGTGKGYSVMTTSSVTFNSSTNPGVFNALQRAVYDGTYTGATVAYTARSRANVSSTLDAVLLDLTYYVPVLRGQTGTCVATGTSCPMVSMKNGNNKILLYLQGTTYAPLGYFDILLGNFSAEVAKFGIVARELDFAITNGNPSHTGPIFEIPDNSPGFGFNTTLVNLDVYVCPGTSCTSGGELALNTKVKVFDDGDPSAGGDREMSVLSWSHTR
ncbi:hypothetical protein ASE01_22005 [Nocardioides sp. Root190]|uniref:hypothetical protein n=1 Tax=Nocardioides sp. Root190 TaxID=1736488 RepID=UPI0007021DD3|nr:hypothetical protein [Nocardioides sp. Root190]KRB72726.1 hypothetical protein ASE01_22005 [Nocardioides sp. Root190]